MMKIRTKNESTLLVVTISGKFNIEEVVKFEEAVTIDPSKGFSAIAIDFTEVEYIDSSALGSLIKLMNKAKNVNIEFILYNMSQPIMSIFRLAYLDKFFSITTTDALTKKYPGVTF
jgi:anti-anti-sigma factor